MIKFIPQDPALRIDKYQAQAPKLGFSNVLLYKTNSLEKCRLKGIEKHNLQSDQNLACD